MTQTHAVETPPTPPLAEAKSADERIIKLEAIEKQGQRCAAAIAAVEEQKKIYSEDQSVANESKRELETREEYGDEQLAQLYRITRNEDVLPLFRKEPAIPENGAWRVVTLASLAEPAIKPGILARLAGAGIETMGALCDFQAKNGDMWDRDVKGVGKAALDHIAEATTAFWQRWATTQGQAAETAAGDTPPAAEGAQAPSPVTPPAEGGPGEATEPPEPAGGLEPTS
jgi:hypothetical protein